MNEHYDFSNAEKGRFFRPRHELRIPVYLDEDVEQKLTSSGQFDDRTRSEAVNELLRRQMALSNPDS